MYVDLSECLMCSLCNTIWATNYNFQICSINIAFILNVDAMQNHKNSVYYQIAMHLKKNHYCVTYWWECENEWIIRGHLLNKFYTNQPNTEPIKALKRLYSLRKRRRKNQLKVSMNVNTTKENWWNMYKYLLIDRCKTIISFYVCHLVVGIVHQIRYNINCLTPRRRRRRKIINEQ